MHVFSLEREQQWNPRHHVEKILGKVADGDVTTVSLTTSPAANPAFDVTPAALVTGLITERGVCAPGELRRLYGR